MTITRAKDSPTTRQAEVLELLARRWHNPPTVREIGEHFGVNVNAVTGHLKALRRKGYIEWDDRQARSIRVLKGPSLHGDTVEIMGREYYLHEVGETRE